MTRKLTITAAALIAAAALAVTLAFTLGGNGARPPAHHPVPAHVAALFTPAQAAKTCGLLRKSPAPLEVYSVLVINLTVKVGGTSPKVADARKARRILDAEIATTCPEFNFLPGQYDSTGSG